MKSPLEKYSTPGLLKMGAYVGEAAIVAVLFGVFYVERLSPGGHSLGSFSTLYGYMSMAMILAYSLGVLVRPISFFYRSDRRGSMIGNVTIAVVIQATAFLLFMMVVGKSDYLGGWRIVGLFVAIHFCLYVWRFICRALIQKLRSIGRNSHQVVLVGANDTLHELVQEMKKPFYGYRIAGYFNDVEVEDLSAECPYLGTVAEVAGFLNRSDKVRHLYCSLPSVRANEIRAIIDACEQNCVHFFSVPQVRNYLKRQMRLEIIGLVPVLGLREDPLLLLRNRLAKRTFDIVFSLILLIPFWLIVYPLVAIGTMIFQPGPIFFRQKRNGINGEVFEMFKFRSMKVNTESDKRQATKDDERVTRFGRFLRKSSIDELPQLINVLKGDMSIVGPRPHMEAHTEEYSQLISKYMVRHWVRPGITGWAQVNNARGETRELWQMEDRIRKDIWYVENWTMHLDYKIILMTVWQVLFKNKNVY